MSGEPQLRRRFLLVGPVGPELFLHVVRVLLEELNECISSCPTCLRKSRTPARGSRVVLSSSLFGCPSYAPLRRLRVCLAVAVVFLSLLYQISQMEVFDLYKMRPATLPQE